MKTLSRKPFLLMLKDESGEVNAVKLDPDLVNSDNAIIVLDEVNDACWAWVGRNVSMPTRMHALRIARGLQKSGYQVGITTIGLAASRFVEMMEKDDSNQEVADNIVEFRSVLEGRWSFDDGVLAYKGEPKTTEPIAGAPKKKILPEPEPTRPTLKPTPEPIVEVPKPKPEPTPTVIAETVEDAPPPAPSVSLAEKKMAYLMLSVTRNSDLVYTERFERGGKSGLKIESPGVMVLEAVLDGNELTITPGDFGDSDIARKIKSEYEGLASKL
ncbi:MAG: hypothetical protein AM326_06500 [Candidatus Thorarchaeota archaeon SMTZ-45]|nr:MAG: hypothetical protein AM325_14400 [Candidatus Thorarchaeota archaeon SMTZ1-45]KXH76825.1 MAG: hypothetical protein AM326_06500 [Candidatus Thorarchaeota archaeon SMTZ-45]